MRGPAGYAAVTLMLVGLAVGLSWLLLSSSGRTGVMVAAAVAWPVQVAAFALLHRMRERGNGFLAVWAGGTLVRMGVVLAAAIVVANRPELPPLPTLLALASFFFVMLLLEPLFFLPRGQEGTESGRSMINGSGS